MSKSSERVKRWRKRTKTRMIEAMGGKCGICDYNKSHQSLSFHHLDPSKKDMGLGAIRGNIRSWERIVTELRKCVLLCSNCHMEVHEGITILPENLPRFNEEYLEYKDLVL